MAHRPRLSTYAVSEVLGRRASIDDVARRANVSSGTVSRALRGLPNVAAATRERVFVAAAELKYVASSSASSLASGKMSAMGVVVPCLSRWFFAQVVEGVDEALREAGFDLVLLINEENQPFETLSMSRGVDCALLLTLPPHVLDVAPLLDLALPIGTISREIEGLSTVTIDDDAGALLAVNHLIGLGHRRVAMIGSRTVGSPHISAVDGRRLGYRQALRDAGIEWTRELEVDDAPAVEGGQNAAARLLGLAQRPTAIFAETDEMAMGALRTLRRAGLRCPEDISVIGFDGHDMGALMDLTTVAQPARQQGKRLAELVLHQLIHGASPTHEVVNTHLEIRGTTAPPTLS